MVNGCQWSLSAKTTLSNSQLINCIVAFANLLQFFLFASCALMDWLCLASVGSHQLSMANFKEFEGLLCLCGRNSSKNHLQQGMHMPEPSQPSTWFKDAKIHTKFPKGKANSCFIPPRGVHSCQDETASAVCWVFLSISAEVDHWGPSICDLQGAPNRRKPTSHPGRSSASETSGLGNSRNDYRQTTCLENPTAARTEGSWLPLHEFITVVKARSKSNRLSVRLRYEHSPVDGTNREKTT